MTHDADIESRISQVIAALKLRDGNFGLPAEVAERTVRDSFHEREGARIKDFVAPLAERAARERLRRMAAEVSTTSSG